MLQHLLHLSHRARCYESARDIAFPNVQWAEVERLFEQAEAQNKADTAIY